MPVTFQPEGHIYRNDQGERYISVTTLIGQYKAPFDSEYWSTYKALKVILERKGTWTNFKRKAGGWTGVVEYYKTLKDFPYEVEFRKVKAEFIHSWAESGRIAREVGTAYHELMEDSVQDRGFEVRNNISVKVCNSTDLLRAQNFSDNGVYTELLLYNDFFRLAGMVDKVIKERRWVHIHDYKTSRQIEMEAFQEQTLKAPLNHLPACNYYEYTMQLSIYAWMLEINGYKIGDLIIEHVPDNHKEYPVKYLRTEVQKLLTHYGKSKGFPVYDFPYQRETGDALYYPKPFGDGEVNFSITSQ